MCEYDGTGKVCIVSDDLVVDLEVIGKKKLGCISGAVDDNELVLDIEAKVIIRLRELSEALDCNFRIGYEDSVVVGIVETGADAWCGEVLCHGFRRG